MPFPRRQGVKSKRFRSTVSRNINLPHQGHVRPLLQLGDDLSGLPQRVEREDQAGQRRQVGQGIGQLCGEKERLCVRALCECVCGLCGRVGGCFGGGGGGGSVAYCRTAT